MQIMKFYIMQFPPASYHNLRAMSKHYSVPCICFKGPDSKLYVTFYGGVQISSADLSGRAV
jgi:hypothetical protein